MAISSSRAIKHPRSIAVVNYKGGVGKTTVTYLLGLYISLITARRTLLIDIDAQCSLTIAVGLDPEYQAVAGQNVYNLVTPSSWPNLRNLRIEDHIRAVPGLPAPLYILPGGFNVEDLDIEIVETIASHRERSKDEFFLYCRQLINSLDGYGYVLIDCPPNKMYLTQGMLRASSYFLPVTIPDKISIYGMPRLLRWVNEIEAEERPKMLGYILNAVNRIGGSPAGMVISQQAAANELEANLLARLSRYEKVIMQNSPGLGAIPRLDAIARFLGDQKEVHLDFARKTSGQKPIDDCLTAITQAVLGRMASYGQT
jgi:cellulose biosynthesis protein BcsQ